MPSEKTAGEKEAAWVLYEVEKKTQEQQGITLYKYLKNKKKKLQKALRSY